jgi:hypothetical protein
MNMPTTLSRWFQFNLSTLLILTAIAAWGTSYWPFVAPNGEYREFTEHGLMGWGEAHSLFGIHLGWRKTANDPSKEEGMGIDQRVQLPLIALAAFLEWKIAMAVAAHRARNCNAAASQS